MDLIRKIGNRALGDWRHIRDRENEEDLTKVQREAVAAVGRSRICLKLRGEERKKGERIVRSEMLSGRRELQPLKALSPRITTLAQVRSLAVND